MYNIEEFVNRLSREEKKHLIQLLSVDDMNESCRFENGNYCPYCHTKHVIKKGIIRKHQRFYCLECKKYYTVYAKTILNYTKKDIVIWKNYIKMMFAPKPKTLKQIAQELSICYRTAFNWRHKILKMLNERFMNDNLKGIIEADETFILTSHKGQHITGVKAIHTNVRQTLLIQGFIFCHFIFLFQKDTFFTLEPKIKRNVLDHIILFKFWVTPASFPGFDKNSLNEFMHQQMDWIENNVGGLNFFDLINIEVKEEKQPLRTNSDIYVEFMFYLSKEKFDLASALLKIKGYTHKLEEIYPSGMSMFYNCTSLTVVNFPAGYSNLASHLLMFSGGVFNE